jgi:hypothetical protein
MPIGHIERVQLLRRKGRIVFMKPARYIIAMSFVFAFVSSAFCQDEVIVLRHDEVGMHERPAVKFNHEKHQEVVSECTRCHHDYDEYMNNVSSEGRACSECHGKTGGDSSVTLVNAFHLQCKTCHNAHIARVRNGGPVMCGQCHLR